MAAIQDMPARVRNWGLVVLGLVAVSVIVLATRPIVLGLDLQGGIHLVLAVDESEIVTHELKTSYLGLSEWLTENDKPAPQSAAYDEPEREMILRFADEQEVERVVNDVDEYFGGIADASTGEEPGTIRIRLDRIYLNQRKSLVLEQTTEILARRINETGITEPVIHRQGFDKIVVQLAGVTTSLDLRRVIEQTAVLKFKLVDTSAADKEALLGPGGEVPEGKELYPQYDDKGERVIAWYLVDQRPEVDGALLEDARTVTDQRNLPAVSFTWSAEGADRFGQITRENVGRQLAIILDEQIRSAPVIQSEIRRTGQITGNFTLSEAQALAVVLRAGPLPVSIEISEQRLVGPSLGHDSIRQGTISMIVGSILVIIFVLFYYRKGGAIALVALTLNMIFIMAFLAAFGAVLTLPGIAGLVLTVGMAIDSNVLIFERMREELRGGKSVRASIDAGYGKATTTILDANVTTLITGIVLFLFGTGPVKGFAVILTVGILSSVFTSVIVTRLFYDYLTSKRRMQTLSI